MHFTISLVTSLILAFTNLHAEETKAKVIECKSSKEFITTFNFLKNKKEFELDEKSMLSVAQKVSLGCNDSANRFIKILNNLLEAEVNSKKAIEIAIKVANEDNFYSENFLDIFKKLYVEKYFDLPVDKALQYTIELTPKMEKEPKKNLEDFNLLTSFCMGKNELDLTVEKCALFVKNTLISSKDFNNTIAKDAISFYDFLVKDDKGPHMKTMEALKTIEETVKYGPTSFANFQETFSFAMSPNGLSKDNSTALKLAKEITSQSFKK